jgi:hypothetical protein
VYSEGGENALHPPLGPLPSREGKSKVGAVERRWGCKEPFPSEVIPDQKLSRRVTPIDALRLLRAGRIGSLVGRLSRPSTGSGQAEGRPSSLSVTTRQAGKGEIHGGEACHRACPPKLQAKVETTTQVKRSQEEQAPAESQDQRL